MQGSMIIIWGDFSLGTSRYLDTDLTCKNICEKSPCFCSAYVFLVKEKL